MAKTLSERLAAHVKTPEGQNRSIFLALREEIEQALKDGWSAKAIWELLKKEGKINVGYHAFNRQVNQLIKLQSSTVPTPTQPPKAATNKKKTADAAKPNASGFRYNPTPNKEELI